MLIISVPDNENNRWKRNTKAKKINKQTKKNKDRKEQGGTKTIVKGWELNNFAVHLS